MAAQLRKPFSGAYALFVRIAELWGIAHHFEFDDALAIAQRLADYRAEGDSDAPDFRRIGQLPYLMLSYLGQLPPPELVRTFRERLERIRGYVGDGSINGDDLKDLYSCGLQLRDAKRDMIDLRKYIKPTDGGVASDVEVLIYVEERAKLACAVMTEFAAMPPKPSEVQ